MSAGILIGDPEFQALNLQKKIWDQGGQESGSVWTSPFIERDVDGIYVLGEWLAEKVTSKKTRKPGKIIFKELNLSLC